MRKVFCLQVCYYCGAEEGELFNFDLATALTDIQLRINRGAHQLLQLAKIDLFQFIAKIGVYGNHFSNYFTSLRLLQRTSFGMYTLRIVV